MGFASFIPSGRGLVKTLVSLMVLAFIIRMVRPSLPPNVSQYVPNL